MSNNKVYQSKKNQGFIPSNKSTKKKKNSFLFYLLIVLFIFWSVGSTLGTISYFKNKNSIVTASAEESNSTTVNGITFDGVLSQHNFQSYVSIINNWQALNIDYTPANLAFDISVSNSKLYLYPFYTFAYIPYIDNYQSGSFYEIIDDSGNYNRLKYYTLDISNNVSNLSVFLDFNFFYSAGVYYRTGTNLRLSCDTGFNGNVSSLRVGHYTEYQSIPGYFNYIKYIDTNNKVFEVVIEVSYPAGNINSSAFLWKNRTYILGSNFSSDNTYQLGYQDGYDIGEQNGYDKGYETGRSEGYIRGEDLGYTKGYNNGYSEGVNDAGQFTFLSLLTSVVDAPIQAIRGLLNFEILGFNLSTFFFSIITICIIIFIVRLFF